jgi:hypothetical protein
MCRPVTLTHSSTKGHLTTCGRANVCFEIQHCLIGQADTGMYDSRMYDSHMEEQVLYVQLCSLLILVK